MSEERAAPTIETPPPITLSVPTTLAENSHPKLLSSTPNSVTLLCHCAVCRYQFVAILKDGQHVPTLCGLCREINAMGRLWREYVREANRTRETGGTVGVADE